MTNSTSTLVMVNATDNQTNVFNATVEFGTSRGTMGGLSGGIFWNATVTLTGDEGSNTLTVRVFDNATNTQTITATYWIDTISPVINITNPSSNGTTVHNPDGNVTFNWTVTDVNASSTNVTIYDLQGNVITSSTVSNQNGSVGAILTGLKPGPYTASFGASDGAGNGKQLGTNALSFTLNSQQNSTLIEVELNNSFGPNGGIQILNSTGQRPSGNVYFNQTLIKSVFVNSTRAGVNVTVNITALGINFNENKTTALGLTVLTSASDSLVAAQSSGVNTLDTVVLFKNMSQYIGDNNYTDSDGTKQWVVLNILKALGKLKPVFINDDSGRDLYKLSQCASNTVPTTAVNRTNACYTNGSSFVNLYVPHLSGGALADPQNGIPTINLTTPNEDLALPGVSDANLVFTGVVKSVDLNTSTCVYNLTNAAGTSVISSTSFTPSQAEAGSTNYTFTIDADTTLTNSSIYNLTVRCDSNSANVSAKTKGFVVNDTTRPAVKTLTSSSSGTTTVTLTWTLTTNENATCRYTTNVNANFTHMNNFGTTGAKTHTSGISYTSDTSGTYYFACNDTTGNGNGLNYTNSSAFSVDVTPAAAAAVSSGGGGSTTTTATTAEGASSTKKWITALNPGATATMNILDAKIPVTSLSLEIANRVEKVEIKVTKLNSAPATAVPEGTGKVHSYLKVDTQNLKDTDIKSAKFKFKVEKSWLTANNYQISDVLLTRFDGVKWTDLPTKSLGATDGVETFEAVSPGFSTFAIVGRTKVEAVKAVEEAKKAEDAAKTPEVKEEPKAEEKKEEKKAETPVIPTQPKKPYTGWIVALIIVVVAVAGYFVWQKKKND
ncbi:TPA: PGF-pre-PGF domain-containing protein [Candidatus Woesearchaeota archaeon]|nr:PGF-pre-PGF domain-containing protein [Candidatus Woesearchaeota archaeon]